MATNNTNTNVLTDTIADALGERLDACGSCPGNGQSTKGLTSYVRSVLGQDIPAHRVRYALDRLEAMGDVGREKDGAAVCWHLTEKAKAQYDLGRAIAASRASEPVAVTDNEAMMLDALVNCEMQDGNDPVGNPMWSDIVCEGWGRSAGGVVASLVKKGLVDQQPGTGSGRDGATMTLTAAGAAAYAAADQAGQVQRAIAHDAARVLAEAVGNSAKLADVGTDSNYAALTLYGGAKVAARRVVAKGRGLRLVGGALRRAEELLGCDLRSCTSAEVKANASSVVLMDIMVCTLASALRAA